MVLEVQKTAGAPKTAKNVDLLTEYLAGTVVEMQGMSKVFAEQHAREKAEKVDIKGFDLKEIETMQKNAKAEAKKYGVQEKMFYHADGHVVANDEYEKFGREGMTAMVGFGLGMTGALAGSPEVAIAGMGGALAYGVTKMTMRYLGEPTNEAEAKKSEEFKMLKHTQLALKQLKKVVEAPIKEAKKKEYWDQVAKASMGINPAGYVTPISLAKKGKDGR